MHWEEMRKDGRIYEYLPSIWERESKLPKWWHDAMMLKNGVRSMVDFFDRCREVQGLFGDDGKLKVCVAFENRAEPYLEFIHFSVIDPNEADKWLPKMIELRDEVMSRGITSVRCWPLKRNRAVIDILSAIGFRMTGLFKDEGESHGRPLRWVLMEARAGSGVL